MVDIGGSSDLLAGLSASAILGAMENYHKAAKDAGATKTVACTVTPIIKGSTWGYTEEMESKRQELNLMILNSSVFDEVADIAGIAQAQNPDNSTYFYDGLHPAEALAELIAETISILLR